jgi:hypothetical protein
MNLVEVLQADAQAACDVLLNLLSEAAAGRDIAGLVPDVIQAGVSAAMLNLGSSFACKQSA